VIQDISSYLEGDEMENIRNMADQLLDKIDEKCNPCVIGLDPDISQIPEFMKNNVRDYDNPFEAVRDVIIQFNKQIIDAVSDIIPAVKPQMAFYEQYGSEGVKAFEETVKYAKGKGLIVIEDAKRNDIGSTVKAYANGHLGKVSTVIGNEISSLDVDIITVTPYLGSDGIRPFINVCKRLGKGIFILVKTSNPSSGEIQDKLVENTSNTVYETVAKYVAEVGNELIGARGYSAIGAVVGATYPSEAKRLREIMNRNIFLVPGYGAQGGKAEDVVPCFNDDGYGAVVSSSRGVIFAYNMALYNDKYRQEDYYLASREAAIKMRDDIVNTLKKYGKAPKW